MVNEDGIGAPVAGGFEKSQAGGHAAGDFLNLAAPFDL